MAFVAGVALLSHKFGDTVERQALRLRALVLHDELGLLGGEEPR